MVVSNDDKTGNSGFEVALIDLGHARELSGGQSNYLIASHEGTVIFQAPEQMIESRHGSIMAADFMHAGKAGLKTDIYALGATILFVMSGILPWTSGGSGMDKRQFTKRDQIRRHMETIIRNCRYDDLHLASMHVDPTMSWSDEHKSMAKPMPCTVATMIKQMLNVIIGVRPSASEVVQQLNAAIALGCLQNQSGNNTTYPYFGAAGVLNG